MSPSLLTGGGSLNLTLARPGDAATYTCTATNPAGRTSLRTAVSVLVPPVITSPLPALKALSRAQLLRLKCAAAGFPPPNISWIKDGHRLRTDAGRVKIEDDDELVVGNLQSSDAGIYQCVAYGKAGYTAKAVQVVVGSSAAVLVDPPSELSVTDITSRSALISWTVDPDIPPEKFRACTVHVRPVGGELLAT